MIFLTLGSHQPFDRLVEALDRWAADRGCGDRVFGQITDHATYTPKAFEHRALLDPAEFKERCREAEFIVSHAGMGTIITALTFQTPAVMMPRRAHLGEMRNDHQVATAQHFEGLGALHFVMEAQDLGPVCDALMDSERATDGEALSPFAQDSLIDAVRAEVFR